MRGTTDKPIENISDDFFKVQRYINGLSQFIVQCDTPMTIAIQGDWGSGKTSMMNMIKQCLGEQVVPVWFNTWQFSQFRQDDDLPISFLTSLVETFGKDNQESRKLFTLSKAIRTAKVLTIAAAEAVAGTVTAEALETSLNKNIAGEANLDMARTISKLKEQYQAAVNETLQKNRKDRIVVFVDDLDRLHPAKAVELLEVLKVFLDCDNCVYVLAIDYDVVTQGIKQKYGDLIGEAKGKSFFDKIIQVPFKMPVAQYAIKTYISKTLGQIDINIEDGDLDSYVNLIQTSIGYNPRSMKRLFNAYLLLTSIAIDDSMNNDLSKKILFAVLCMQLSFEKLYNYIVSNTNIINSDTLNKLANGSHLLHDKEFQNLKEAIPLTDDTEIKQIARFMSNFNAIIDKDCNQDLSDEEIDVLKNVLGFSTITSAIEAAVESDDSEKRKYRALNRRVIKKVNERLTNKYGKKTGFTVYQSNSDRGEDLKFHYAVGIQELQADSGIFDIEYKIQTDLGSKKSTLRIDFYPIKNMKTEKLFGLLANLKEMGFQYEEDSVWKQYDEFIDSFDERELERYLHRQVVGVVDTIKANGEISWRHIT